MECIWGGLEKERGAMREKGREGGVGVGDGDRESMNMCSCVCVCRY